jgi:hypothetical protein
MANINSDSPPRLRESVSQRSGLECPRRRAVPSRSHESHQRILRSPEDRVNSRVTRSLEGPRRPQHTELTRVVPRP